MGIVKSTRTLKELEAFIKDNKYLNLYYMDPVDDWSWLPIIKLKEVLNTQVDGERIQRTFDYNTLFL